METVDNKRELLHVADKSDRISLDKVDGAEPNVVRQIAHIIKCRGMVNIGNMAFTSDDTDALLNAVKALYRGGHGEYPNRERLLELDDQFWRASDTDPKYILSHYNIRDAIDEAESFLQNNEDIRVPELPGEIFTSVYDVTLRLHLGKTGAELLLKHLLQLREKRLASMRENYSSDSNSSHFRSG